MSDRRDRCVCGHVRDGAHRDDGDYDGRCVFGERSILIDVPEDTPENMCGCLEFVLFVNGGECGFPGYGPDPCRLTDHRHGHTGFRAPYHHWGDVHNRATGEVVAWH